MTLIEILVVVAIIATLAAILFPVVLSATESGRQSKCLNNLRTIGGAFALYLNDWNETWPSTVGGAHILLLNRYIKAPVVITDASKSKPETVWACPSMPRDATSEITKDYWLANGIPLPKALNKRAFVRNSYLVNSSACSCLDFATGRTRSRRMSDTRTPSRLVLMTEACYDALRGEYNDPGTVPCTVDPSDQRGKLRVSGWCKHGRKEPGSLSFVHPYHNEGANFLYSDFHAASQGYCPGQEQWDETYLPRSANP